ncbi:hypothetical protein D3C75_1187110 [compost metagenome]
MRNLRQGQLSVGLRNPNAERLLVEPLHDRIGALIYTTLEAFRHFATAQGVQVCTGLLGASVPVKAFG